MVTIFLPLFRCIISQYQDIQKISMPDFLRSCYPIFLLHTYSLLALCSSPLLVGGCVSGWSANLPNCLLIFHISTMFSSLISIFSLMSGYSQLLWSKTEFNDVMDGMQFCDLDLLRIPSGAFQLDFVTVVLISRDRVFIINIKWSVSCKQK